MNSAHPPERLCRGLKAKVFNQKDGVAGILNPKKKLAADAGGAPIPNRFFSQEGRRGLCPLGNFLSLGDIIAN